MTPDKAYFSRRVAVGGGVLKFSWYVVPFSCWPGETHKETKAPHSNCVAQTSKIRAYSEGCANIRTSGATTVSCSCHAGCSWAYALILQKVGGRGCTVVARRRDLWRKKTKKRKRTINWSRYKIKKRKTNKNYVKYRSFRCQRVFAKLIMVNRLCFFERLGWETTTHECLCWTLRGHNSLNGWNMLEPYTSSHSIRNAQSAREHMMFNFATKSAANIFVLH